MSSRMIGDLNLLLGSCLFCSFEMKSRPTLPCFPASFVGGRTRPRRIFADLFSSPVPSWGEVPEADDEAVPMAPLRQRHLRLFDDDDDGPSSKIREEELAEIWRKYSIPHQ